MADEELKEITGDGEQKPEDFVAEETGVKEGEMVDDSESKEGLQSALQILKEASAQFESLGDEATNLGNSRDFDGSDNKLNERAQLLIDLPDRLTNVLGNVDRQTKQQILSRVSGFAGQAKGLLESNNRFGLGVLLRNSSDKVGDKNGLEKLIEDLESR